MEQNKYGIFYTTKNVFKDNEVFKGFMDKNNLWKETILEPFAGSNNLITFLKEEYKILKHTFPNTFSYDLYPTNKEVLYNDSIKNWNYENFNLVITNPPYLAKYSKNKQDCDFDDFDEFKDFDDLYKVSLDVCLKNVPYVIAIIPATLITSNRKNDVSLLKRLDVFQFLPKQNFHDTDCPVALAYFVKQEKEKIDFLIYNNNEFISSYKNLVSKQEDILKKQNDYKITFNDKYGNLGVICADNTKDLSNIKFIEGSLITDNKSSNRYKVKIQVDGLKITKEVIENLNKKIACLRRNHCDYLQATFKGIIKPLKIYRRRFDFKLIKKIINSL